MAKIDIVLKGSTIRTSLGSLGACGVYLISSNNYKILFDTGHNGRRVLLTRSLESLGVQPNKLDFVVLSHLHWDHALNIPLFDNSKIVIDRSELTLGNPSDYARVGFLTDYITKMDVAYIDDGYKIDEDITVLKTPGHTAGHIALSVKNDDGLNILSGDSLPNARAYTRGLPDLIFHSSELAAQSISKIKRLSPKIIYPGHDAPFTPSEQPKHIFNEEITLTYRTEAEEDYEITLRRQKSKPNYI